MKKRKIKLYTCGTTWGFETVPENYGALDFYTSKNAAWDNLGCAAEDGIVEVEATFVRNAVKSTPRARRSPSATRKVTAKSIVRSREYAALGKRFQKAAEKSGDVDFALAAFQYAVAGLKIKRRDQRRRARLRAAKAKKVRR